MPSNAMTPTLPHNRFHSTRLVRLLRDLALAEGSTARTDFAERVSRWVSVVDAITLHAALHRTSPLPTVEAPAPCGTVDKEIARERDALQKMIAAACSPQGAGRIRFPLPTGVMAGADAVTYQPLLAFHRAMQRELEQRVGRLRASTRHALAQTAPRLQQLAAIDEAMEQALRLREAEFLAEVPALLERRFSRSYDNHRQALAAAGQAEDATAWLQPGAWLARFRDDIHDLLQAELALRLQPVLGLAESSHQELASIHE